MDLNSSYSNLTCHPAVMQYRYFGATLGILVTAVGGVGNVMTLLAFVTDPRLRTRFNLLILNLTVSDLLYCGFLQPVTVDTLIHFHWRQGETMCRVFGLTLFVANAVSIFNLILIAMSRYVLISDTQRFDRVYSRRTMPLFLVLPWLLGLALFGPLWSIYVFLPPVCTCSFHRSRGRPYTTILMFFMFGLGLSCIGVFYLLIHRKVKLVARALEEHRMKTKGEPRAPEASATDSGIAEERSACSQATEGTSVEGEVPSGRSVAPTGAGEVRVAAGKAKRGGGGGNSEFKKVTRMCFAMFLVYVACYLPFCLLHVADKRKRAPVLLHMVAGNFTWFNSCINPILYAIMNRQFKEAYRGVLHKAAGLFRCRRRP
ncbi:G-protein coupled receptor 84 [Carcharodon carcharias]|uniref:G-protein coupled receptor 84 n=1 Tax=Carcharodon carcharias TaxID=13397 RepID=UPI001B7F72D1|nr:G-protein coupled receptor 84 [Carcharodon carcharias]